MRRPVFNLLCALSLLLAATVSALWVRGYHRANGFWWTSYTDEGSVLHVRRIRVIFGHGGVAASAVVEREEELNAQGWIKAFPRGHISHDKPVYLNLHEPEERPWNWLGFYCAAYHRRSDHDVMVTLPYWFLLSLTLVLPARWLRAARRRRKERRLRAAVACFGCGYDLRASTGRCPECGLEIPPACQAVGRDGERPGEPHALDLPAQVE